MAEAKIVSHETVAHQKVSIDLLRSLPCYAVRVPPNQKDPGHYGWDPKTNSAEKSAQTLDTVQKSNSNSGGPDNLGVHLFGAVVDVDIDTDDNFTMMALDYYLPVTPHVWGRKSRPRTHRLYQLSADMGTEYDPKQYRFLQAIQKREELKVEIRGGSQSSGNYTLMPGSLHPSGEMYEWSDIKGARVSPCIVSLDRLITAVKHACVASLVARHWTEGQRNAMCQALSGFLWRAHQNSLEMASDIQVPFEMQDAEKLLECIMEIAEDDTADRHMRLTTLKKTWDKAEAGTPVTGARTLKELTGDDGIVSLLYLLLANSPDLELMDAFFEQFAYWRNTSNVFDLEMLGVKGAHSVMSVNDMRNTYKSKRIARADGTYIPLVELYLNSEQKTMVDRMDVNPDEPKMYMDQDGRLTVNQWTGMRIQPYPEEVSDDDIKPFINHVRNIVANGDKGMEEWVMSWCADIFQNTGSKCGTSLVLVGKTGTGKSALGVVMRKIIGGNHSMATNDIGALTTNFNADSVAQLFVQCDEATNSNQRKDALRMNSMITDHTRRIEFKGVDAVQMHDFSRYFFTSNEMSNAIAVINGQDDRRYTVGEVNPKYGAKSNLTTIEQKLEHWTKFHNWLDEPDVLAKIHKWFLQYPLNRGLIRLPYETKAKAAMIHSSMRGVDPWLLDMASLDHPFERLHMYGKKHALRPTAKNNGYQPDVDGWPELVTKAGLMEAYAKYGRTRRYHNGEVDYNANQLVQELINRGLMLNEKPLIRKVREIDERTGELIGTQVSKRLVTMFSRERLKEYLETAIGYKMPEDGVELKNNTPMEKEEY